MDRTNMTLDQKVDWLMDKVEEILHRTPTPVVPRGKELGEPGSSPLAWRAEGGLIVAAADHYVRGELSCEEGANNTFYSLAETTLGASYGTERIHNYIVRKGDFAVWTEAIISAADHGWNTRGFRHDPQLSADENQRAWIEAGEPAQAADPGWTP